MQLGTKMLITSLRQARRALGNINSPSEETWTSLQVLEAERLCAVWMVTGTGRMQSPMRHCHPQTSSPSIPRIYSPSCPF